jgi:hypothetical protein
MTTLHLKLTRTRTNETTTVRLEQALKTINEYHDKQKFMNMLGQENFWKKNRLLLWKDLVALDIKDTDEYRFAERDATIETAFINTDIMINQIRHRIETYYNERFTDREEMVLEQGKEFNFRHNNDYHYNSTTGYREKSLRTRKVSTGIISVRHADLKDFDRDLAALYKKYQVKDPDRLRNGKRYFDVYDVSRRLVSLYYIRQPKQNGQIDY